MKRRLLISFLLSACLIGLTYGQIINIPDDFSTIQAGIDAASEGDTVLVSEETYFENINFRGKAITVASEYILDGDTSHISSTVIDGSQPTNPDSASVVYFISGEDTTSILNGFTITGGTGTITDYTLSDFISKGHISGGGIFIDLCGGKITHNIIEQNHISMSNAGIMIYPDSLGLGAGIGGIVRGYHTLIIRDNIIRNNSNDVDNMSNGGGIGIAGANIIVEGNEISNNVCRSEMGMANGGGIAYFGINYEPGQDIVYIRNNRIFDNALYSNKPTSPDDPLNSMGGALFINGRNYPYDMKVSNNLMYDNYTEGEGGAVGVEYIKFELSNNTFVDNEAKIDGNDLHFRFDSEIIMFNNILWNQGINENDAISIRPDYSHVIKIHAAYNLIKGGWEGTGNMDSDPMLDPSTFELQEGSPCVGAGAKTVHWTEKTCYAPEYDFNGNARPDPVDPFVDMGAIESSFTRTGNVIHVPAMASTIQEGIDVASDGDTVLVAQGIYAENINFMGKAITVASHFIMDGEDSHIQWTLIDGSEPDHPDTASVVSLVSGEDTTSVLCGFSISGGTGTSVNALGMILRGGGGILLHNSGGKILNNQIKGNQLANNETTWNIGAGILAVNEDYRTVIIRENQINQNSINAQHVAAGGGVSVAGGGFLLEANEIFDNQCSSETDISLGGGIELFHPESLDLNPLMVISNNRVYENSLSGVSATETSTGGGIFVNTRWQTTDLKIYNNLIYKNEVEGTGGGIGFVASIVPACYNNTLFNNAASVQGNSIYLNYAAEVILFNNILWSDPANVNNEIELLESNGANTLFSDYNCIRGGWNGEHDIDQDPMLDEATLELQPGSPCIGAGIETIELGGITCQAPNYDFRGENPRPHPIDNKVDIGAIESPFATGIKELYMDPGVELFPNPWISELTIQMKDNRLIRKIEILDLEGRVVRIIEYPGNNAVCLYRENLPPGIYFLRIESENPVVRKVVVQ